MSAFEEAFAAPSLWPSALGLSAADELIGTHQEKSALRRFRRGKDEPSPSPLLLSLFRGAGLSVKSAAAAVASVTIAATGAVAAEARLEINAPKACASDVVAQVAARIEAKAIQHAPTVLPGIAIGRIPSALLLGETAKMRLFDYNKPRLDLNFDPTQLRAELIEQELEAANLPNVDSYPGNNGEFVVEAGPSTRSLTFVVKAIQTLALYRLGGAEDFSKVAVTELPRIPSKQQIAIVVEEYKHASEWQTKTS